MVDADERYSLKEMLALMRTQLDRIESKVDAVSASKADKTEVATLQAKFEQFEKVGSANAATALDLAKDNSKRLENAENFLDGIRGALSVVKFVGFSGALFVLVAVVYYVGAGGRIP